MWMKFRLIVGKTIGLCVRVYNEYDALLGIIADVGVFCLCNNRRRINGLRGVFLCLILFIN